MAMLTVTSPPADRLRIVYFDVGSAQRASLDLATRRVGCARVALVTLSSYARTANAPNPTGRASRLAPQSAAR